MSSPPPASGDEVAIREISRRQLEAILTRDVTTLDRLLAEDFTATHIGGYVQPKDEWLAHITSGRMQYHRSEEVSWKVVTVDADTAIVESRSRLDATIYGSRHVWPIASTAHLLKIDGRWLIARTVSTTF